MPDESQPIIVPSTAHTIDNCEQALTRREALLQILRVGGVAAAAAGAGL